jgi:hypothetical protein
MFQRVQHETCPQHLPCFLELAGRTGEGRARHVQVLRGGPCDAWNRRIGSPETVCWDFGSRQELTRLS